MVVWTYLIVCINSSTQWVWTPSCGNLLHYYWYWEDFYYLIDLFCFHRVSWVHQNPKQCDSQSWNHCQVWLLSKRRAQAKDRVEQKWWELSGSQWEPLPRDDSGRCVLHCSGEAGRWGRIQVYSVQLWGSNQHQRDTDSSTWVITSL